MSTQWTNLEDYQARLAESAGPDSKFRLPARGGGLNLFNNDFLSRRDFIEWVGGVSAVLATSACTRQPQEKIIPYTKMPEMMVPGKPMYYASAFEQDGVATGVLVESHLGRPTKIDGNPEHSGSLGSTDAYTQAAILSLYDPDRAKALSSDGVPTFWGDFVSRLEAQLAPIQAQGGLGLRILSEGITSPTLVAQLQAVLKKYPKAIWHTYDSVTWDSKYEGARLAFGDAVETRYAFDKADVVLSLDSDFLYGEAGSVRYMRDFTSRRRYNAESATGATRLYAVAASHNITAANAEHRLLVKPSEVEQMALVIARLCGVSVRGEASLDPVRQRYAEAVAKDLLAAKGKSVVIPGTWSSPVTHAAAHAINERLGNQGNTVFYFESLRGSAGKTPEKELEGLRTLVQDMEAGNVSVLVMLGGNPAYTAPADVPFAAAVAKVKTAVRVSLYDDETSELCKWRVPRTHFLEQWGDSRAYDGTVTLVQPLIAPLYSGKSDLEVVSVLLGEKKSGHEILKDAYKGKGDAGWKKAIHDGFLSGTASATRKMALKPEMWAVMPTRNESGLEGAFRPDPSARDGRYTNNGWLQELPRPMNSLTWDNALFMSPATAKRLGVESRFNYGRYEADVVIVEIEGRKVEAPVFVQVGHPDNTVTLPLGYGRTRAGRLGNGMGYNAGLLRSTTSFWSANTVNVKKASRKYTLAVVQSNMDAAGREPVRATTLKKSRENPHWAEHEESLPKVVHEQYVGTAGGPNMPKAEADYQWGMSINLSTCTGCNACVVACQSENNIPIVGKVEVERGRHMHWIRVDNYFEGTPDNPEVHKQPVPCMHCETAPCELVCPVNATEHDNEGLNNMVYNRCVGTKYCGNNCPYKVRRFNFYEYALKDTPIINLLRNPDVTVRTRGVMEKCTYCVQRISEARITAKTQHRKIQDGEVKTACQTVCPAQAIVFGDVSDPNTEVSKAKKAESDYSLLADLGTRPRTTYLGKITNPNEALEGRNS